MGKKHAKKRFFCVSYRIKPDKKFDEFITLSKKKIGPGKMRDYTVVLDLINKEVIKNELPGIPLAQRDTIPYERIEQHYRQWYSEAIDQFIK
tara:strand:- start:957 stop:1232 length:276 start_codon:yes stop_codon:yes gene_type:complete